MKSLVHGVRLLRRGPAALAGVLLIAASAYAHTIGPSFTEAEDLGTTTDWSTAGITSVADIPDVEGDGANYFKFRVAERGTVFVWSSGNITPYLQVFEESATAIGSESRSRREVVLDAGVHYVRARWRDAGRYRLHVAGGGRGHDDVGNTYAEAMTLSQPDEPQSDKVPWNPRNVLVSAAKLDYEQDQDWFKFTIPEGSPPVQVRIWATGNASVDAVLYDAVEIELESDRHSGVNFSIERTLNAGIYFIRTYSYVGRTGAYRIHLAGDDDHGNFFEVASPVQLPTDAGGVPGEFNYVGDLDHFWFQVWTSSEVAIWSTGNTRADAVLYDAFEVELDRHRHSGLEFRIERTLEPGVYYIRVYSYVGRTGNYALHVSGDVSNVASVPLMLAHGDTRMLADGGTLDQRGFVRIINHSDQPAEVGITAIDDVGVRRDLPSPLELLPWETKHFNSQDLEQGNDEKGIVGGVGDGTGNWYLEIVPSRPEVEVLSYVRTSDGFLSSMHTQVPSYGRMHRVATFNPGSNSDRKSKLRLIHPRCPQFETSVCRAANVTIYGVDDTGARSPDVQLQVASGAVREVTAAQLEGLEDARDLVGSLGDGERKWQLFITADRPIQVMSLLERAAGHITNFSAPASRHPYAAPERRAQ